jgi:hypothetical protein
MVRAKLRTAAVLVLAATVVAIGIGGLLHQAWATAPHQKGGPEKEQAREKEIAELVRGLAPADVKWDGQWIGIVAHLDSERAKRLGAIGEPAIPALIRAVSDREKFASAHAILTMIASGSMPDFVPCGNGIAVEIPAKGPVVIDRAQRVNLQRRWQKWYEMNPRPQQLPD